MGRNIEEGGTSTGLPATVKTIRLRRGYTAAQLAAAIGKSQGWVSRFETGQVEAKERELEALAAVLDVPAPLLSIDLPTPMVEGEAFALHHTPKKVIAQIEAEAAVRLHITDAILNAISQPKAPRFPQHNIADMAALPSLARQVRSQWGIGEEEPIVPLAGYLEREGIIINYLTVEAKLVHALTYRSKAEGTPLIMLSRTVSHNEQRFALARQYAHIILNRYSPPAKGGPWGAEERATIFARELLAPTDHIRRQVSNLRTGDVGSLLDLCQHWGMPGAEIIGQGVMGQYISRAQSRTWEKWIGHPLSPAMRINVDGYPVEVAGMRDVLNDLHQQGWSLGSILHATKVNIHDLEATVGADNAVFGGMRPLDVLRAL